MTAILDMFSATFDFFVDIGERVDFFGMNIWDISLYVFAVALVGRFLFPFLFNESGMIYVPRKKDRADTVEDKKTKPTQTNGQIEGYISPTYYQQKGGKR